MEIDEFFTGKFPRFNQNHIKPIFLLFVKKIAPNANKRIRSKKARGYYSRAGIIN